MEKADMGDEDDPDGKSLQKVTLSQAENRVSSFGVEVCLFHARLSHKPTTMSYFLMNTSEIKCSQYWGVGGGTTGPIGIDIGIGIVWYPGSSQLLVQPVGIAGV